MLAYSTDSHIIKSIYDLLFSINRLSRSLSYFHYCSPSDQLDRFIVPQISRPITSFNKYRAMCSRNAPSISKVSSLPYKHMTGCDTNSNSLTCLKATSSLCLSLIHMPELAIHLTIGATKQAYVHTVIAKSSMVGERRRALLSWSKRELGGLGLLRFSNSPPLHLSSPTPISPLSIGPTPLAKLANHGVQAIYPTHAWCVARFPMASIP